jgi:hypothetical protein
VWGVPDFAEATVLCLGYVPRERVSDQMARAFDLVQGPECYEMTEHSATKSMCLWRGSGLRVDKAAFLRMFDFRALAKVERTAFADAT